MKISLKVLGPGCQKCKTLEKLVIETITENNIDAEVQKVEDINQIISYGVMTTPALAVNEKVVFSGRVPSKNEIKNYIEKAING
jgi:small redox-active disulfide protein 2